MAYRDILIHVDETPASVLRTRAAADIAGRSGAHLAGVFLTSEFILQFMAAESLSGLAPELIDQVLKDHRTAVSAAAAKARAAFEAIAAEAGLGCDWLSVSGDIADPLIACARRADLTVFPSAARACLGENETSAARLGMACGGPVLVTPTDDYAPPIGKRVLIAWNGSREAARALRDAWPLVAAAEERHVLIVSPSGGGDGDDLLLRRLERHGCKANLILDSSRDESASAVLDRNVAELDIDLVVMGLYGHSRLQELVLGGVSRHMLNGPAVPLLISH